MTIDGIRQKMCDNYCMFPSETGEVPPVICEYCPLNELDRHKEGDDHDD